jgi:phenylacetate-CoA ligase
MPFKLKLMHVLDLYEWDHSRIIDQKNQLFLRLIKKAYHQSNFYKNLYDAYGVNISQIHNLDDIRLLPVINRDHINEFGKSLLTETPWFLVKGFTSGTSGTPLVVYRNYKAVLNENS